MSWCSELTMCTQGMYNDYTAIHAFWADTTNMDNLRGADATGKATPGSQEVVSEAGNVAGFENTVHTYSGDTFYSTQCRIKWPTEYHVTDARSQECKAMAESFCTVSCVTWGHMDKQEDQNKWMGSSAGGTGVDCDLIRNALGQGAIPADGSCGFCPTYTYTGEM